MTQSFGALIACSNAEQSRILAAIIGRCGLVPFRCSTIKEAKELLAGQNIRLTFCDDHLSDGDFRDALRTLNTSEFKSPLVVFSPQANWNLYSEAIQLGAFDCIGPFLRTREIEQLVDRALNRTAAAQSSPERGSGAST